MWCDCTGKDSKRGFIAYPDLDSELWVHAACLKPTRTYFMTHTLGRAPRGATALLGLHSRKDGMHEVTYSTGTGTKAMILVATPYDRRPHTMGVNPNDILLNTWKQLDFHTAMVMEQLSESSKPAARAVAEVLAIMMPPFFDNADDIVREAVNRYKNRDNPDYETPGLGVKFLSRFDQTPYRNSGASGGAPGGKPVSAADLEQIRKALNINMLTIQEAARMYNTSVEQIIAQLGVDTTDQSGVG